MTVEVLGQLPIATSSPVVLTNPGMASMTQGPSAKTDPRKLGTNPERGEGGLRASSARSDRSHLWVIGLARSRGT